MLVQSSFDRVEVSEVRRDEAKPGGTHGPGTSFICPASLRFRCTSMPRTLVQDAVTTAKAFAKLRYGQRNSHCPTNKFNYHLAMPHYFAESSIGRVVARANMVGPDALQQNQLE